MPQHNTDTAGAYFNNAGALGPMWSLLVSLSFGITIMVLASATLHTR